MFPLYVNSGHQPWQTTAAEVFIFHKLLLAYPHLWVLKHSCIYSLIHYQLKYHTKAQKDSSNKRMDKKLRLHIVV